MYILDTSKIKMHSRNYLIYSIIVLLISIVYEMFSHNVYSNYMIFSFVIPLVASLITFFFYKINKVVNNFTSNLFYSSVLTLTTGSFIKGVLDIYGTTNSFVNIYLIIGIITILLTIVSLFKKVNVL